MTCDTSTTTSAIFSTEMSDKAYEKVVDALLEANRGALSQPNGSVEPGREVRRLAFPWREDEHLDFLVGHLAAEPGHRALSVGDPVLHEIV